MVVNIFKSQIEYFTKSYLLLLIFNKMVANVF